MNAVASSVQEAGIPLEITMWNMEKTGISKISFNELAVNDAGCSGWKQCNYEPIKLDTGLFKPRMMLGWYCREMVCFCAIMYLALLHPPVLQGSEQVSERLAGLVHLMVSTPSCLLMYFLHHKILSFL